MLKVMAYRRLQSSELCRNSSEAGCEHVIANLRDHCVRVGTDYFEIGPPFRKRPVARGNPSQPDLSGVATNWQRALDNFIGERVVPVIE